MAYRRSISTRLTLVARQSTTPFSYIVHDNDHKQHSHNEDQSHRKLNNFLRQGLLGSITNTSGELSSPFRERRCSPFFLQPATGDSFYRYMSTSTGEGLDKVEYMSDVAEVLVDKTVEAATSQVPIVSEVAVAAADSFPPVAALQYLIDAVHSFTGLNWWAAIALTTLLIRGATVPLLINQLKATSKLTLMRPHLEEIKQQMQDGAMDPKAVAEGKKRMQEIFNEYGVTPFTPLKGLFIQGPIFVSFFFAISNMVEKVPSFKGGGALWFTDLTTPDSLYILPVLAALTFLINVEANVQEGLEGNPVAGTMKNFSRILAVLTVPFTMSFPKAIFCYWVTSNLFSLMYGLVLRRPGVKKYLAIPEIAVQPATTSTTPQPTFSLFSALKQQTSVNKEEPPSLSGGLSAPVDKRISTNSVISQRLRSLEKQVKGRKKNKKR